MVDRSSAVARLDLPYDRAIPPGISPRPAGLYVREEEVMHSRSRRGGPQQKRARVALVARVLVAYDQFRDAARRQDTRSPGRRSVVAARSRFEVLNRALALLALQAA